MCPWRHGAPWGLGGAEGSLLSPRLFKLYVVCRSRNLRPLPVAHRVCGDKKTYRDTLFHASRANLRRAPS